MRAARAWSAAFALLTILGTTEETKAQAVAYFPQVGTLPDGVALDVVPVVSADRRYVRLSLNPQFQTVNGFQNLPVPAAVSGGGGGGGPGGGGLGGGGLTGMNGPIGPPPMGPGGYGHGYADPMFDDSFALGHAPRRAKAARPKPARAKKPAADPKIIPAKAGPKAPDRG